MTWAAAGLALGLAVGWAARMGWERRDRFRRGRMLSFVAHELNTPLTAVNMTVLNFMSGIFGPLGKDQQDWMLMMKEQVTRLNGLVGELRDFIHLEFQRDLRIRPEPCDLGKILQTVLSQSEGTVTRSGARLNLDIPSDLPQVSGDPDRLQRVLASVLAHARKFRKDGPIAVSARVADGKAEVRFAYTANTLPGAEPERMLDLYYPIQGGASSQLLSSVGTGLGLCRILLEKQGGSLGMNIDGAGATELRISVPLAQQ
ncbi:MAG: HAMP domain-containing histidine kinase [Elusimicrobia bacterium]|nr:HAMP domain-containing histidine kinase [Elusimicrobiota bacterium]